MPLIDHVRFIAVILGTTALASCSPEPPTSDEIRHAIMEDVLVASLLRCQSPDTLSQAEIDYLTGLTKAGNEYAAQRYLLAMGSDAACQERAIRTCESISPGQCVAERGEIEGRQP